MKPVYFTAVYKGVESGMQAQVIGMDERICAMSWSHAIDEKNEAQDKIKELSKQRDELLEALKSVSAWSESLNRIMPTWLESKVDDAVTNAEK